MKKLLFAIVGLIGLSTAVPKFAHSEVSFSIFISNAPPPPRVAFVHQPRFVLVPEEQVYYCDGGYSDYDMFQYESYYYLYDDGYWYRGPSYSGPFVAIRIEYVPRQIFYVSDYGYRWRQAPRWGSRSYSRWDSDDRRFRDWRYGDRSYSDRRYRDSDRYAGTRYRDSDRYAQRRSVERRDDGRRYVSRDGSGSSRLSEPWRGGSDPRAGVRQWSRTSEPRIERRERSDRQRSYSDRRESRSRGSDGEWRGNRSRDRDGDDDQERGHGKGKGKGKGNGHGHGRGHNKG